ncbi:hypothetical protein A2334_01885 [Candidatus Roizmanbacteria bacterium RIFOXYB2_FULL_38_10]|uniref:Cupin type-2 domain-containing protein n=1 Tax=Candidatus Roizmanbacteria bacterium RIFOXYD1_FULL_38_12 TaxID=1802093 RepID=A0A1F7L268_9BACT|nr:MAG: hypothetical protein A3K47_05305 [Candidatus Roizmanbacteria bacterium RIFOXYA2_FULL_38_14]OGK64163.1 MAG: hypothetical protein A3K27_05305 [Candidatus Roizmanbacteria bacterium RIFOXYA1_FULL_37_12]OGK66009.1 MAG: hypothetical protein A3K38_05305 [Candidatus Roizmanbacteria bacterium RIFOXYB1_FULL_40_23]OGK67765.1 MAG: hypothetical protein A2334_01885 [Candidatus Roizmanbacteria bacterium RIFOXYB2_FULL_38_10]OGK70414.1 MAG: hypothetical protein A3K21_05310 [Candidatus Roizmanbacteria ba
MHHKKSSESNLIIKKDYSKQVIFSLKDFREKGHLMQVVTIPPHTRQRLHAHHVQTEVYYVLEGETLVSIDGKEHVAKPGDAFMTHPDDRHYLWNKSDRDFKLLVFKINYPEDSDDTDWLEE